MSLMRSLEIGKQGLAAQQAAITTAGHNIANLSTPGYARQRVQLSSSSMQALPSGVTLDGILQIRDQFLDRHLLQQTQELSRWQASNQWLQQVEGLFMTDGEAPLSTALGRFWDSWQDLANDPTSEAARETVVQRGQSLTFEIQTLYQRLNDIPERINQQVSLHVHQINSTLERVATLNRSIAVAEADGQSANDLRDERAQLVHQLAEKMNVEAIESPDNVYSLSVSGVELLRGEQVSPISVAQEVRDGQPRLAVVQGSGEELPITSGELAGLFEVRDDIVPELRERLNTLTQSLIEDVNAIHRTGYGLEYQTGLDFFSGTDSSNIQVAVTAAQVATSSSASSLSDNTVALDVAQLRVAGQVGEQGSNYEDFFDDLVTRVGMLTQEANRFEENQARLVDSLKTQQQSVSSVSLDEEMTTLIQFQRAYEASARYLSTVDELLQSVIGMVS